jgi:6-phosphogluconate dehydrogenase (decarboxylating)
MQIGVIGLGRMGGNISRRLMKAGHTCIVFDANDKPREALAKEGATAVQSLEDVVKALKEKPRAVWVMLPAGQITETTIGHLGLLLEQDDIIIDGGNSFYKDDIRRAKELAAKGIRYIDCGTSGGVWGIDRGYCMMIGGQKQAVDHLDPIFATLAPGLGDIPPTPGRAKGDSRAERGYIHAGPAGAGHFVKMVHNGIEYGLMQAYAEGFDILRNKDSKYLPEDERFTLNLPDIAEVWRRGSVISSWLLDLSAAALAKDPQLKDFSGFVQDSGEGRWTVQAAIEEAVPADVLSSALYARFRSRQQHTFGEKDALGHALRLRRTCRRPRINRPPTKAEKITRSLNRAECRGVASCSTSSPEYRRPCVWPTRRRGGRPLLPIPAPWSSSAPAAI